MPSALRFARHSMRGKPAQPSALDAPPAAVFSLFDLTGFPAPAGLGAGALPPGWLPVRGRTSGRLGPPAPAGSPQALYRPCWGRVRLRGQRAAMP